MNDSTVSQKHFFRSMECGTVIFFVLWLIEFIQTEKIFKWQKLIF